LWCQWLLFRSLWGVLMSQKHWNEAAHWQEMTCIIVLNFRLQYFRNYGFPRCSASWTLLWNPDWMWRLYKMYFVLYPRRRRTYCGADIAMTLLRCMWMCVGHRVTKTDPVPCLSGVGMCVGGHVRTIKRKLLFAIDLKLGRFLDTVRSLLISGSKSRRSVLGVGLGSRRRFLFQDRTHSL